MFVTLEKIFNVINVFLLVSTLLIPFLWILILILNLMVMLMIILQLILLDLVEHTQISVATTCGGCGSVAKCVAALEA